MNVFWLVGLLVLGGVAMGGAAKTKEVKSRTWADTTGEFRVVAQFKAMDGDNVKLLRADGRTMTVAFNRLSEADRAYVKDLTAPEAAGGAEALGGRLEPVLRYLFLGLGALLGIWAIVWLLNEAFAISPGWGAACLLIPGAALLFVLGHWDRGRGPTMMGLLAAGMLSAALFAFGGMGILAEYFTD